MAENHITLPQAQASRLKCIKCQQYLSVSPITYSSNGCLCGRCSSNAMQTECIIRAEAYETLAQIIQFPCRYDALGCTEYLRFEEVQNHENTCSFRAILCPIASCALEVKICGFLQHFQRLHKYLITTSGDFLIPEIRNVVVIKLMVINGDVFLLEMCLSTDNKCWLALKSFDAKSELYEESYRLEIKSLENPNILVLNHQMTKYSPNSNCLKSYKNAIDMNTIKTVLKSDNFKFEIKLTPKNKAVRETKNSNPFEELECEVCGEYMAPPIYTCKTGHSVCSECRKKLGECPTCKAQYDGARNYALEKLTVHFDYPCKNRQNGCSYVGTAENLRSHELSCRAKVVNCPLSQQEYCRWKGPLQDVYEHSKKFHPHRSWIKLRQQMYRNMKMSAQEYNIVSYDQKVFKVFIKHDTYLKTVQWAVQQMEWSSKEKPEYEFTLRFLDQTGAGRRLTVSEVCYCTGDKNDFCIILPFNLLKSFIVVESDNNNKLIYSLSIEKINNK